MTGKRLLVCGGRHFADVERLERELDHFNHWHPIALLIHGGATGADSLAAEWARRRGIECLAFPVSDDDWRAFGKRAGPIRNQRMIDEGKPDEVFAFPGGNGTADMIARARAARLPLSRIL